MESIGLQRVKYFALFLLISFFSFGGCSKDNNPTGSEQDQDINGTWIGTTSDGLEISFNVKDGAVKRVSFGYRVENCNITGNHSTDIGSAAVSDNAFTYTQIVTDSGSVSFEMKGIFASGTSSSGTLLMAIVTSSSIPPQICTDSVSWSAVKSSKPEEVNLTGTWTGTSSSNLVPMNYISLEILHTGSTITGTYNSTSGAAGTLSGTVTGKTGTFTLTQTTPSCTGSFTGNASVSGDTMNYTFTGYDCLGTHTNGHGRVVKNGGPLPAFDSLFFEISLANLPSSFTFNQSYVSMHNTEYWWGIMFNTDDNNSTGLEGFDIEIAVNHAKMDSNSFQAPIITGTNQQVIEWTDTSGQLRGYIKHFNVPVQINPAHPNTLTLSAPVIWDEISRITPTSKFYIHTFYRTQNPPNGTDKSSEAAGPTIITDPVGDTGYDFIDITGGGWSLVPLKKNGYLFNSGEEIRIPDTEKIYWENGMWIYWED